MDYSHCNWIYSILDGVKEQENILHKDSTFLLLKNYTFIDGDIRTLYCLAIPTQRHGLKSVRDLTSEHLPMLKEIERCGLEVIQSRYGVSPDKVRVYFHYHPTYYHLHVHFTHVEGETVNRACVQLAEAITNIELIPDFYQRTTLVYTIGTHMPLYKAIVKNS